MATMHKACLLSCNLAPSSTSSVRQTPLLSLPSFVDIKAGNKLSNLGLVESTETQFSKVLNSCRIRKMSRSRGINSNRNTGGGALDSTCDVASEVFKIIPIMSGLVLMGVSVGFFLLWIESLLEESEN